MMASKWIAGNMPTQDGKVAVVTGANSGIGYEMTRELALKGATVVMACRSKNRGELAASKIRSDNPNAKVILMLLDLGNLAAVRNFSEEFKSQFDRLDMLINNAGVMNPPFGKTADGFELQFGINHLGHFALTGLLLDIIVSTPHARIVVVSSVAHQWSRANIDFDNLNAAGGYDKNVAYAQSKLANVLFAYELQRRLEVCGYDTITAAVHPGWVRTNLFNHTWPTRMITVWFGQSPAMGALPALYAATEQDVHAGDYYQPDRMRGMRGHPEKVRSSNKSYDATLAANLWTVSEKLTGVHYLRKRT